MRCEVGGEAETLPGEDDLLDQALPELDGLLTPRAVVGQDLHHRRCTLVEQILYQLVHARPCAAQPLPRREPRRVQNRRHRDAR